MNKKTNHLQIFFQPQPKEAKKSNFIDFLIYRLILPSLNRKFMLINTNY